jgi:hypothetical protein
MRIDPAYEAGLTEIYIHNEAELRRIGTAKDGLAIDNPNRTFYLEDDIVLTEPWTPIGSHGLYPDPGNPFKAKFDGQGHGITINSLADPSAGYLGLFGYTDGAEIKNLKVVCNLGSDGDPLELTGTDWIYIGALAGYADNNSRIENITVSGSLFVISTGSYGLYAGGIAGVTFENSKIRSCHVRANLYAETQGAPSISIGGVAGEHQNASIDGIIENSSFTGTLRGWNDFDGVNVSAGGSVYAGGIVGNMWSGSISACYSSGIVDAWSFAGYEACAGGIAGGSNYIERCYAWTIVSAEGSGEIYAGGIAGVNNSGTFSQCYALGDVTVTNNGTGACWAGGIAGKNYQGHINYCAALNDVGSNNSPDARGIAGRKQLGTTFTSNYAASDMTISYNDSSNSWTADTDLDGNNNDARANFEGPPAGTVYGSGSLDWKFTPGTGDWKFIPGYAYPVLSWQTAPPADPSTLFPEEMIPQ